MILPAADTIYRCSYCFLDTIYLVLIETFEKVFAKSDSALILRKSLRDGTEKLAHRFSCKNLFTLIWSDLERL